MGFLNEIGGILQQYGGTQEPSGSARPEADLEQVAGSAPPDAVAHGLSRAFRSDQTPAFGQMVSQLFANSNSQQRAGLLSTLLSSAGPGVATILGSSGLSGLLGTTPTPEQASAVPTQAIEEIARHSEEHDPTVIDRVSHYYAQHPQLIATVGKVAAGVALAGIAEHVMNRTR